MGFIAMATTSVCHLMTEDVDGREAQVARAFYAPFLQPSDQHSTEGPL